ncbi:hypothetical protein EON64_11690, partial [archaeon]
MTSYVKTAASLGSLSSSARYQHHISEIKQALEDSQQVQSLNNDLVNTCNEVLQQIEEDVFSTYRFVSETYAERFPELEPLIPNRTTYIKVVQRIGNEGDVTTLQLSDLLSAKQIMLISVSISTTSGQPLSREKLQYVKAGCADILTLEDDRTLVLGYLEHAMLLIAPNLCALIGSHLTAQLLSVTGGLEGLVKVPACNIQVLGQERRTLLGLSGHSALAHAGILSRCDIVDLAPPEHKQKTVKVLAAKVALLGRVDYSHFLSAPRTSGGVPNLLNDNEGRRLRKEVLEKLAKLQEAPKARTKKALPVPDEPRTSACP